MALSAKEQPGHICMNLRRKQCITRGCPSIDKGSLDTANYTTKLQHLLQGRKSTLDQATFAGEKHQDCMSLFM